MHSCAEDPLYRTVVIKNEERFWKRILIIDDDEDIALTFKAGIEDSNNYANGNKRIEVYTSNDPILALNEFKPNFYETHIHKNQFLLATSLDILLVIVLVTLKAFSIQD